MTTETLSKWKSETFPQHLFWEVRCSHEWDFSDCHSNIIRSPPHNRLHGPFYGSHLDLNYFQAAFPSTQKARVYSRRTADEKGILSWSTTRHILKNAVWFKHTKCTHIDRCSRLPPPSPANTEHIQKWLLQARSSETKGGKSPFCPLCRPFAGVSSPPLLERGDRM